MTALLGTLLLAVLAEMRLAMADIRARVVRLEDFQMGKISIKG